MPSRIAISDLLDFCSPQNPALGNVDDLRATLMAFSESIPVTAFFDKQGSPYTFRDICEMAKKQIVQLQVEASRGKTSSALTFLRNRMTIEDIGQSIVISNLTNVALKKSSERDSVATSTRKALITHGIGTGVVAAFLALKDYRSRTRYDKITREKIQQNISKWEADKNTAPEFPAKIHEKIKQACADSESNSIKDIRVWVMEHHPRATARVLVHPSGRLLTEREICMALKLYG